MRPTKQERRLGRQGELGRPQSSPVVQVPRGLPLPHQRLHGLVDIRCRGGGLDEGAFVQRLHRLAQPVGVASHGLWLFLPHSHQPFEGLQPLRLREVRPTPNRPAVRHGHAIQRPSAPLRHELHGVHVHLVHVGPFFAVHLDTDKVLVHEGGRLDVFERFVFHHVAPMASAVPDAHNDRFVQPGCFFKRGLAPSLPMNRVELMLQQIGRSL